MPTHLATTPLAKRRVQWTLASIVCAAIVTIAVARQNIQAPDRAAKFSGAGEKFHLDLNRADVRELALLPGVGPVLADRIVHNRERQGAFESLDDLSRVYGIGDKTIARISTVCEVTVNHPPLDLAHSFDRDTVDR